MTIKTIIEENPKVFRPSTALDGEISLAWVPGYENGIKLDINPEAIPELDYTT